MNVWNPENAACTLYRPAGRDRMRYCPPESVVASAARFVSTFVAVTRTPWITADDASVTMPRIIPVTSAIAILGNRTPARSSKKQVLDLLAILDNLLWTRLVLVEPRECHYSNG